MILINKRRTSTSLARRPTYLARMARSADEVRAAQRLRFEVFNLELNEGLAESHFTGLDADVFPATAILRPNPLLSGSAAPGQQSETPNPSL